MTDEQNVRISVSLPLDSDGFLRRECPTCEREFKWLHSDGPTEGGDPDPAGYYCPYCGVQAHDGWLTKPQAEVARAHVVKDVVGPMLDDFTRKLQGGSSGMFKVTASREPAPEPPVLSEPDDMRRVGFTCHPTEPIKVLEDWTEPLHCLICGTTRDGSSASETAASD